MSDAKYQGATSFIVKWVSVILFIIFLFVIYVPNAIWDDEVHYQKLAHWKMNQLWDAERAYFDLTGEYNSNLKETLTFVSMARDSVLADSMYLGEQIIHFKGEDVLITMPEFWADEFDTLFSFPYMAIDSSLQTIYKAVVPNEDTGMLDTLFLNKVRDKFFYSDSFWTGRIIDTTDEMRYENVQKYKRFNLVDSLLVCPLTGKEYFVKELEDDKISIVSPTKGGISFGVHTFWTFQDTGHGSIIDGEPTWK